MLKIWDNNYGFTEEYGNMVVKVINNGFLTLPQIQSFRWPVVCDFIARGMRPIERHKIVNCTDWALQNIHRAIMKEN